jgi:hypothetical protein
MNSIDFVFINLQKAVYWRRSLDYWMSQYVIPSGIEEGSIGWECEYEQERGLTVHRIT